VPWKSPTQTEPKAVRATKGRAEAGIVSTTWSSAGSIRVNVPSFRFGIHSRPSGPRVPSAGLVPTLIVAINVPEGSRCVTVFAWSSDTHTPSSCGSTHSSLPWPTWIVRVLLVRGSMRTTSLLNCCPTQTAPAPARMHVGEPGTRIVFTTLFVLGEMRETVLERWFDAHTAPKP
jgi:hypothetical protein